MHPLIYLRNLVHRSLQGSLFGQVLLADRPLVSSRPIHLVCATRLGESDFWQKSALGKCLKSPTRHAGVVVHIHYSNRLGLPVIYNAHIGKASVADILLFVHDDIIFNDINWPELVRRSLGTFDIVGVAGNVRLQHAQPAWLFRPMAAEKPQFVWDHGCLSGVVFHEMNHRPVKQVFGPTPMPCKVLDGVFLAVDCAYLKRSRVRFDERFPFHFYDMDFCRSAGLAGLTMGTWPISLTHLSAGAFGTQGWQDCWKLYQTKWKIGSTASVTQ